MRGRGGGGMGLEHTIDDTYRRETLFFFSTSYIIMWDFARNFILRIYIY